MPEVNIGYLVSLDDKGIVGKYNLWKSKKNA